MEYQLNLFDNKKTTVVHFKKSPYDVYIGRGDDNCPWGNPFEIGRDGTRKQVIEKYKKYFYSNPELMERAKKELRGKVLGCWCKPKNACHGDVIAEFLNKGI